MKAGRISTLMAVAMLLTSLCCCPVQAALYLRFTFNEHPPGVAPDDSIVANTGHGIVMSSGKTYRNGYATLDISYVAAPGGSAMHFDAAEKDYVKLVTPDVLPATIMDGGMSIVYWLRFDTTSDGYMSLWTTGTDGSPYEWVYCTLKYPSSGEAPYNQRVFQNPYYLPPADATLINADTWYQLVWTIEGPRGSQRHKYYIDGQIVYASTPEYTMDYLTSTSSRLGITWVNSSQEYRNPFGGDIDQVDIYDVTLSSADVDSLYALGPSTSTSTDPAPPELCSDVISAGHQQPLDFDGDCYVGLSDFAVFAQQWLDCMDPTDNTCDTPWFD